MGRDGGEGAGGSGGGAGCRSLGGEGTERGGGGIAMLDIKGIASVALIGQRPNLDR